MRAPGPVSRWRTWFFWLMVVLGGVVMAGAMTELNGAARMNVALAGMGFVMVGAVFRFGGHRF
ncbi:MAG: hypothetical protein ACK4PI_05165 [Tepidisphaerales bacterium]